MRGKGLLFSGVVILAAIAAGALSLWRREALLSKPQPVAPATPTPPPSDLTFSGKVRPQHLVTVAAPVDGVFEIVLVEAGQDVSEGQVLARIKNQRLEAAQEQATLDAEQAQTRVSNLESTLLAARLEAARADADLARARAEFSRLERAYQRQQLLHREGATPRLAFEKAEKEYNTAQLEKTSAEDIARLTADRVATLLKDIELAKKTLDDKQEALDDAQENLRSAEIHSPVDGLLVDLKAQTGAEVDRSVQDLFQIATDVSALEVTVDPPTALLPRIKPGVAAMVTLIEAGDQPLPGTVKAIHDNQIVVEFSNPNPNVKPGLIAQVKLLLDVPPAAPAHSP